MEYQVSNMSLFRDKNFLSISLFLLSLSLDNSAWASKGSESNKRGHEDSMQDLKAPNKIARQLDQLNSGAPGQPPHLNCEDVEMQTSQYEHALNLSEAIEKGDIDAVRAEFDRGADANSWYDRNALKVAVFQDAIDSRDLPIIRLFLEKGADPSKISLKTLLSKIKLVDGKEETQENILKILELLVRHGANLKAQMLPLFYEGGPEWYSQASRILAQKNKFLFNHLLLPSTKQGPLFEAIQIKNLAKARVAIADAANVKAETRDGLKSPLNHALSRKDILMAHLLLEAGADPNLQDEDGTRPLLAVLESPELVKTLLEAGADPNLQIDLTQSTPLQTVLERAHRVRRTPAELPLRQSAELLVGHGADREQLNLNYPKLAEYLDEILKESAVRKQSLEKIKMTPSDFRKPSASPEFL